MVICAVRDISDSERGRLARELHDDIGQRLMYLKYRVSVERIANKPASDDAKGDICRTIDGAIGAIDRICRSLTPLELDHFGLEVALKILIREFLEMGLTVRSTIARISPEPSPAHARTLFRVVQESLSNVHTHAGEVDASVTVHQPSKNEISVEVRDDGAGFDPVLVARGGRGLGLLGMAERAAIVGGTLEVESRPGEGTVVRATVPVGSGPVKGRGGAR